MEINGVLGIQLFVVSNISALEQFFLFFLFKRGIEVSVEKFSSFIVPFYSFLFIRISYNF